MSADLLAVFGEPNKAPTEKRVDQGGASHQGGRVSLTTQVHESKSSSDAVLFDADEAEAEDDFGDFEDVEAGNSQMVDPATTQNHIKTVPEMVSSSQRVDLLDLGNDNTPDSVQVDHGEINKKATMKNEVDEWGDFEDFAQDVQLEPRPSVSQTTSHIPAQPAPLSSAQNASTKTEDVWDDFEEWNADQASAQDMTSNDNNNSTARERPQMPDEPRPANIPPPTILLQLLPQVFQSIQEQATQSHEPNDIDETAALIVTVFAVSARIIAGRSLRWKRDTYLAQSTSIGPSTSGARSGGMKLTAVNKSEAIREEREAADVCDAWSRNTYIFAGVVSRSEHRRPWMNLNIKMTPRPSPGFGTLEAREPCALCGIKRDERIAGVDFDADDVFNEYWTEHWGHTDCKIFWYTYRNMLDHR